MCLGQEIYTFFNKYGEYGLIGLTISIVLISIIIYKTFKISLENEIDSYQEFLKKIMPQKFKSNKGLIFTINSIINIFLLTTFNIMVAGFSTYFTQEINISKWIGAIIIAIMSFVTFSKSINGIIKINTYLIPIVIGLIVLLGINNINISKLENIQTENTLYWSVSSILYASYNSITLIPVLVGFKKQISSKKEAAKVSGLTFVIMIIVSLIIFLLMNLYSKEIKGVELPIVYISTTLGKFGKYIYGIVVLIAIFTTAISAGYGFLSNNIKTRKQYLIIASIICTISIFVGQIGFSNLINILYPIFGYLGIVQIIFLLIS